MVRFLTGAALFIRFLTGAARIIPRWRLGFGIRDALRTIDAARKGRAQQWHHINGSAGLRPRL